jgi:hypothetical protein
MMEQEHCRRELGPEHNYHRCGKPARYIVWGKFFPEEARGPRCDDCAWDQLPSSVMTRLDQAAI